MTKSTLHVVVTMRLPQSVIEEADRAVKKHYPTIKSRTHLVEIAISEYLKKLEAKP